MEQISKSPVLAAVIVALGLASAGMFVGRGIIKFKKFEQAVEVKGLAERMVKATDASWKIHYQASGADLNDVNERVSAAQKSIMDFLVEKGFAKEEIQKEPASIADNMAYGSSAPKPGSMRYHATGSFVVGTKKVDVVIQASETTDELLKRGVVLAGSAVSYYFTEVNSIKPEMLKEATAAAKEAALSFAANSGAKVGKIRFAEQGPFEIMAPFQEYGADSVMKKVRVVTHVSFFLD